MYLCMYICNQEKRGQGSGFVCLNGYDEADDADERCLLGQKAAGASE